MTDAQLKLAAEATFRELRRHTDVPGDMLVVIGTVISGIARGTTDPVDTANAMIEGLQGWIRLYEGEQGAAG